MALILTEEQSMLRDSARDFLATNAPVSQLRALRDAADADGFSRGLWKQFGTMGFAGVMVPESQGGLGLGHVEAGILMEEIGRTLACSPMLSSAVLGATLIARAGSPAQCDAWLPRIAEAGTVLALAIDEHAKHRPERIATRVHAHGGGWRLDGQKCFVVDGHVADAMIVSARDDAGATRLLLVPTDADGVEIERTIMVDAHNAARVRFAGVSLPADAELGAQPGDEALAGALDSGRAVLAAELLGLADEAFERTLRYLAERRQFGRAIGEFQALQHRAAHLYCELEVTRAAVLHALQALDDPEADTCARAEAVAVAKARACASATLAVQEGVQMHGGIGMTDEFEIGFFMKRARAATELLGDDAFHAERLARLRAY